MTSTPHTTCTHPATKAGRAACRKIRASRAATLRADLDALTASYYNNQGSCEGIAAELCRLSALAPESPSLLAAATGYYTEDLDMTEIIALAHTAKMEIN